MIDGLIDVLKCNLLTKAISQPEHLTNMEHKKNRKIGVTDTVVTEFENGIKLSGHYLCPSSLLSILWLY